MKEIYEARGITLSDILPPGFPKENLPPVFPITDNGVGRCRQDGAT